MSNQSDHQNSQAQCLDINGPSPHCLIDDFLYMQVAEFEPHGYVYYGTPFILFYHNLCSLIYFSSITKVFLNHVPALNCAVIH